MDVSGMIDISVSCQVSEGNLLFWADVARGNGSILAEGPAFKMHLYMAESETIRKIEDATTRIENFIMQQTQLISDELTSSRS